MNSEQLLSLYPLTFTLYLKPSNPMPHRDLNSAIDATERGMWSEVIDYLQRLPLAQINELEVRSKILDLAVEVLLQGDFEEQWDIAKIIPKLGEIAIQPLLDLVDDLTIATVQGAYCI